MAGDLINELTLVGGPALQDLTRGDQQVAYDGKRERVDHFAAFSALMHQAVLAEDGQLVRQAGSLDVDGSPQLMDGFVAIGQQLEQADPGWVPERSEEVGLGSVKGDGHLDTNLKM
jgi:hypothetical protein